MERVLGNKTLEVEILKEAVRIGREKKTHLAAALVRRGGFPVKRVTDALAVSRSNTYERIYSPRPRPERYNKAEDAFLLPLIVELLGGRQTYGYRRIQRLLNRQLIADGRTPVNHKRIYWIMRQNNLLLARVTGSRPNKTHTGKVSTLQSNQRWCSDEFEIACDNGERVRVIFALDTCDREVMAYAATTGGYSADMAQSVMLACVEKRFGDVKALRPVEWLSDNGSCYTARETITFAASLGVVSRFTPAHSPQSNGMAEALVKTFKRDYVFCNDRPDAETVMAQLSGWFEDYNENAPHKALRMFSPREFIRSLQNLDCPV